MNKNFKIICFVFISVCCSFKSFYAQTRNSDSLKQLLCGKSWHLVKLTEITGGVGQSMGGELFNIDTKFNMDGTIETSTAGNITKENWILNETEMTIETGQLKDPKTGQEKIKIIQLTDSLFVVNITYRGNNIMQYAYKRL